MGLLATDRFAKEVLKIFAVRANLAAGDFLASSIQVGIDDQSLVDITADHFGIDFQRLLGELVHAGLPLIGG